MSEKLDKVKELILTTNCAECGAMRGYDEQDELVQNVAKEIVKFFAIPRVSKRFSFADFAIGLMAGIFGTIIAIAYIL